MIHPKLYSYLNSLSDAALIRFEWRIWQRINRRYGAVSWDAPTLFGTFPELANSIRASQLVRKGRRSA